MAPRSVLALLVSSALAATLGCGAGAPMSARRGGAPPRTLRRVQGPREVESVRRPVARGARSETHETPWTAFVLEPTSGPLRWAGVEADGSSYVLLGGARGRVREQTVTWAPDLVLGGIAAAVRSESAWLFAGNDGALYRAPFFTAPLERVGATDGAPLVESFVSAGRLVARDDRGRLWIGSRAGLSRWDNPGDGAVLDASFADERFGVVVRSPGRALMTVDGGARWTPLSLGSRAISSLVWLADGLIAHGPDGAFRLQSDQPPAPFTGIAQGWDVELPNARALRASASEDIPGARLARLTGGAMMLSPSRVYTSDNAQFGAAVRRFESIGDEPQRWSGDEPASPIESPGTHCHHLPWGPRMLAFCRDIRLQFQRAMFVGDGVEPWTRLNQLDSVPPWATFASSSDGHTLWSLGACDSNQRTINQVWCRLDGERWSPVEVERRAQFVASHEDLLVFRVSEGLFERGAPGPMRVRALGQPWTSARPPLASDVRARMVSGSFLEDGTFFGRATVDQRAVLAIGSVQGRLAIRALPEGATDVAMANARRGIASGDHLDKLWTTEDGGRSWSPLPLPIRGSARGIAIGSSSSGDGPIRCSPFACSVSSRVLWTSEALAGRPPIVMHSAPSPDRGAPTAGAAGSRSSLAAIRLGFGSVRCTPEARNADERRSTSGESFGAGGWFRARPEGIAWGGFDARGAFRGAVRATLPPVSPPGYPVSQTTIAPRYAARGLTLVERCDFSSLYGGSFRGRTCKLFALRDGQPPREWLDPSAAAPGIVSASSPRIAELTRLADGSFGVRLTDAHEPSEVAPLGSDSVRRGARFSDVILRLDADGAVRARSSYVWSDREVTLRALAVDRGELGLVVLPAREPTLRFFRSPAEEGRPFAAAPLRLRPCGDPSATGVDGLFITSSDAFNVALSATLESGLNPLRLLGHDGVESTVERGPSGVCIRRVTAGTGVHSPLPRFTLIEHLAGALTIEADGGQWIGRSTRPDRHLPMRCVPTEDRE
jgi:hypothetical protein